MQIFSPSSNALSRVAFYGSFVAVFLIFFLMWVLQRSYYATQRFVARDQTVPFSHAHHVGGLGIDCRYCHVGVEKAAFAGIPDVNTCMSCHSQIYNDQKMLEPVREAYRAGTPLTWNRVNEVPDFVYFDHAIHVHKGIGCATCHGRVDEMPLTWRQRPFYMHECVDCHRHPELNVQPRETVFDLAWEAPSDRRPLGLKLVKEYRIKSMIDCATCHR